MSMLMNTIASFFSGSTVHKHKPWRRWIVILLKAYISIERVLWCIRFAFNFCCAFLSIHFRSNHTWISVFVDLVATVPGRSWQSLPPSKRERIYSSKIISLPRHPITPHLPAHHPPLQVSLCSGELRSRCFCLVSHSSLSTDYLWYTWGFKKFALLSLLLCL